MRALRAGDLESGEATAPSPMQQVYLFSLTAASGEFKPCRQKEPCAVYNPGYPWRGEATSANP